ncbi:MAG: DUF4390 domain-containing protein [Candidatus Polarisedimenticolia bacterium]
MKSSRAIVILVSCLAVAREASADPVLVELGTRLEEGQVLASVRLEGALTPALAEEIGAGLETTVEYRLHLYRRRSGFLDALVARRQVACTVRHDTLTRQFTLVRRVDGEIAETRVTDDEADMRAFLTGLRDLPVAGTAVLEPGRSYYLKAKSNLGLVWRFYLIPWSLDTPWIRAEIGAPAGSPHATHP